MAVKQISLNVGCTHKERTRNGAMIRDEIALLSQIHHPHVVRFFGAVEEGFHVNLFMEWMPGGSVAKLLEMYGPFNESITLRYAFQVLLGLEYLHAFGILHRDLKGRITFIGKRTDKYLSYYQLVHPSIHSFIHSTNQSTKRPHSGLFTGHITH